jgi:diaminohydroxyphosphoribosylaminopyrimidine deaminase/5-amino-6-(5-phosphoribosylamino)uracil reductase
VVTADEVGAGAGGKVDLRKLGSALYDRGCRRVLLEGGPTLAGAFIEARCVDEVIAYIAPKLLGTGQSALGDAGIGTIADALTLEVDTVSRIGGDVKIVARPVWSEGV